MDYYDPTERDPTVEAAKLILTGFALDYPGEASTLFGERNARAVQSGRWGTLRLSNDLVRPHFRYAGENLHAYLAVVSLRMALEAWDPEFASDWWLEVPIEFTIEALE